MKRILVLQHPTDGTVQVPVGFSWAALVLGPLWAMAKRLWFVSALLVLVAIPIVVIDLYSEAEQSIPLMVLASVLGIAYMVICGKYASGWWLWTLERRGYRMVREDETP
jgi:hypothetical protein